MAIKTLADLTPDARNANKGTKRGGEMVEDSLRKYGAGRSILIDKHGRIIAGNKTVEQAGQIGLEDVIVVPTDGTKIVAVQRTDLDLEADPKAKELAIADNRAGQVSLDWDVDVLAELSGEIDLEQFWSKDELAALIPDVVTAGSDDVPEAQIDKADELRQKWNTGQGQIWEIPSKTGKGNHRLMCGDSTSATQRTALLSGCKPALCFTSPPYSAQRTYTIGEFDWDKLMDGVFVGLADDLAADASILVNLGLVHDGKVSRYWDGWINRMETSGVPLYGWYVWDQGFGLPGDWAGRLAPSFEFMFHFGAKPRHTRKTEECKTSGEIRNSTFRHKDGSLKEFTGNGTATASHKVPDSVVRVNRQSGPIEAGDHPAVFSVQFPEYCIPIWTDIGESVYEPFAGSGSTTLAAERVGRLCYGMEIEPKYVAVALERMSQMGLTPKLVSENGTATQEN